MSAGERLNLEDELIGMSVVADLTSKRLGEISDAVVNPTKGTLIALSFHTADGQERWLTSGDFHISQDVVTTAEKRALDQEDFHKRQMVAVCARRELIGAKVITDEGKMLGYVIDVQISATDEKFFYRVAHSRIERILSGGFLMAGDAPRAYFRAGLRLIVPASLEDSRRDSSTTGLHGLSFGAGQTVQVVRDFVSHYGVASLFIIQAALILWLLFA